MRTILIATALLVASLSASFAQQPRSYHPGIANDQAEAPAKKTEQAPKVKRDYQAEAQQRFAAWQGEQVKCFTAIGMKEGVHFRFDPQNPTDVQVARRARLAGSGFDQAEIDKCIARIGN